MKMLKCRLICTISLAILTIFVIAACAEGSVSNGHGVQSEALSQSVETVEIGLPNSASIFRAPVTVQELVNRSDAVVIATISSISETKSIVLGSPSDAAALVAQGYPEPRRQETHYELSIEQVLLDHGSLAAMEDNPKLALSGTHKLQSPQTGERMMFSLLARPDPGLYSLAANWSLIPLDGGAIRNFDDTDPAYAGVTDEESLKSAVAIAAKNHDKLPPSEWPSLFD